MNSLADEWKLLEQMVLDSEDTNYTDKERHDIKRGFYAGAVATLTIMFETANTQDDVKGSEQIMTLLREATAGLYLVCGIVPETGNG